MAEPSKAKKTTKRSAAADISIPTKRSNPVGRPTEYNQEIADKIIDRLSTSTVGLKKSCADLDIDISTLWRWIAKHEEFRDRYDIAKELQTRLITEELDEIGDDRSLDLLPDGRINGVAVQRDKLRIETREYLIERLSPKKKEEDKGKDALQGMLDEAMAKACKSKERDY